MSYLLCSELFLSAILAAVFNLGLLTIHWRVGNEGKQEREKKKLKRPGRYFVPPKPTFELKGSKSKSDPEGSEELYMYEPKRGQLKESESDRDISEGPHQILNVPQQKVSKEKNVEEVKGKQNPEKEIAASNTSHTVNNTTVDGNLESFNAEIDMPNYTQVQEDNDFKNEKGIREELKGLHEQSNEGNQGKPDSPSLKDANALSVADELNLLEMENKSEQKQDQVIEDAERMTRRRM